MGPRVAFVGSRTRDTTMRGGVPRLRTLRLLECCQTERLNATRHRVLVPLQNGVVAIDATTNRDGRVKGVFAVGAGREAIDLDLGSRTGCVAVGAHRRGEQIQTALPEGLESTVQQGACGLVGGPAGGA